MAAAADSPPRAGNALRGRTLPHFVELPGRDTVFLKHYHRGGMLGRFVERGHLWNPRSRGRREFESLLRMRALDIPAPQPLAFMETIGPWQHTWLVLAPEPDAASLVDVAQRDPVRAEKLLPALGHVVARLVHHRILHVDLHPGNVLIGNDDRIVLIDFDKAENSGRSSAALVQRYLKRWARAVTKHKLPSDLHHGLARALQSALPALMMPLLLLCCLSGAVDVSAELAGLLPERR